MTSAPSKMTFRRVGRAYHLLLQSADDLRHVLDLDEAHWVATSAPIDTIHPDPIFLDLLDLDHDGRIRPFELRHAVRWALDTLRDTDGLSRGSSELMLAAIDPETEDGRCILATAEKIVFRLAGEDPERITLDQVRRIKRAEETRVVSEAGIVLADTAEDESTAVFMDDVVASVGGPPHPSGKIGVTRQKLDQFLSEARGFLDWRQRGLSDQGRSGTRIMPLGEDTSAAFAVLQSMRAKVDQYFAQCEAVTLDPTLAQRFGSNPTELNQLDLNDPAVIRDVLRQAPLAPPRPQQCLNLDEDINPACVGPLAQLRRVVLEPTLGGAITAITEEDWQRVKEAFLPYETWMKSKVGASVEALGMDKLKRYLDERYANAVGVLLEQSHTTTFVLDNIRLVEKLLLYQANLLTFANNYVSFPDLYRRDRVALFDEGNLIMDGRRFNLAVRVHDRAEHARIARGSNIHVLYVEVIGRDGTGYEVAVAVTSGGRGNLCLGKRGVFHDVNGDELHARIVQVIENPISLREAIVAPFKRLAAAVMGKIQSIARTAETELDQAGGEVVTKVQEVSDQPQQTQIPQPQASGTNIAATLAGGGIAIAALGSSLAFVTKTLAGLSALTILASIGGAILAVVAPTILIAFTQLRRRDLGAILEGSGWAINARMSLTRTQSRYFTECPAYPTGARGLRHRMMGWAVAIAIFIAASGIGWERYQHYRAQRESGTTAEQATIGPESPKAPQ